VRVTILGAGASSGTPSIETGWGSCDRSEPRNRRTRPSILVEDGDTRLLVDTSPDLRGQLLAADVRRLNAVIFTHGHADHLHGIDDLRGINRAMGAPLPIFASGQTLASIERRFGYTLQPVERGTTSFYRPALVPHEIGPGSRFRLGGIEVAAFEQIHGRSTTLGLRFGDVAYSTDVVELPEDAFAALDGLALWILGTFSERPHYSHCHVDQALAWIERVRPRRAVLSHLSNELDFATLSARLPAHVRPAHDGMVLDAQAGFSCANATIAQAGTAAEVAVPEPGAAEADERPFAVLA
jgi:phosphoribosyl 1,2-cyclic phosphate phosphodiesterase